MCVGLFQVFFFFFWCIVTGLLMGFVQGKFRRLTPREGLVSLRLVWTKEINVEGGKILKMRRRPGPVSL